MKELSIWRSLTFEGTLESQMLETRSLCFPAFYIFRQGSQYPGYRRLCFATQRHGEEALAQCSPRSLNEIMGGQTWTLCDGQSDFEINFVTIVSIPIDQSPALQALSGSAQANGPTDDFPDFLDDFRSLHSGNQKAWKRATSPFSLSATER